MKKNENVDYCTFYIVRHGETHMNAADILQGQSRMEGEHLNEKGEAQAQELALMLKDVHFDGAFSSDLIRAKRTAEIVLLERRLAVVTTEALREKSFGRFEGATLQEMKDQIHSLQEEFNKLSLEEKHAFKYDESMESNVEAILRLSTFLREVAITHLNKTVLIGCHGAIMRAFLIVTGWANYEELPVNSLKNTAYVKVRCDGVEFFIDEVFGVKKASA